MQRLYYSTNTWLAYMIAQRFFGALHYVWCAPSFNFNGLAALDYAEPPSSCPAEIYIGLVRDVESADHHSSKIEANRVGILRGAAVRRKQGHLTTAQHRDIVGIVRQAEVRDFRPLIYVIPHAGVRGLVREVPLNMRAHPLSVEYLIEKLPRKRFDVIEVRSHGNI